MKNLITRTPEYLQNSPSNQIRIQL